MNSSEKKFGCAEIATMVVEILKNDAITGEIIRIDGGLHLVDLELTSR